MKECPNEDASLKVAHTPPATGNADTPPRIGVELRKRIAAMIPEQEHDDVLIGQILFEPHFSLAGLKTHLIASKLSNLGNIRYFDPPLADVDALEEIMVVQFAVVTDKTPEAVRTSVARCGRPTDERSRR